MLLGGYLFFTKITLKLNPPYGSIDRLQRQIVIMFTNSETHPSRSLNKKVRRSLLNSEQHESSNNLLVVVIYLQELMSAQKILR